jgi:hypothetical protein
LGKDLTPVSITLEEFIAVPIPFSIELLSKSTFEAPNFILFFGFIYRSRSIRSGAVERIFLAHLVWFGFIFLCFCFWFGDLWFCGVARTRRRGKTDFAERRLKNGSSYGVFVCFASAHCGEETWLWTNMFELLLVCSYFTSCCSKSELHLHTLSRILRLALLVLVISRLLHFCVFLGSLFTMSFLWVGGEWPKVGKLKIERANPQFI